MFVNKHGLSSVADMNLSRCFNRLDQDLILKAVNRKVSDARGQRGDNMKTSIGLRR